MFLGFNCIKTYAVTTTSMGYYIQYNPNSGTYNYHVLAYSFDHWFEYPGMVSNNFYYANDVYSGTKYTFDEAWDTCEDFLYEHTASEYTATDRAGLSPASYYSNNNYQLWIYNVPYRDLSGVTHIDYTNPPEPPEPEPGNTWLGDMWDWFLWQLGINDDYSGDIDEWITGGDREPIELITPTPSPTPTPYPSPTPYSLNINYPDGTSGTITGIPGNTNTIINGGDTINNGSDFDIFAVDLQIGDGGTSNPRDGLNSIMDSNKEYLSDIDISPISNSFSLIPNDWFLLIGVLGAIPIIAGFISKLLK